MRKLSLSLFILLLAYWGQSLIRTGPTQAAIPARDGLIILAVAGLLFALNARPQASRPAPWPPRGPGPAGSWPGSGSPCQRALLFSLPNNCAKDPAR